MYTPHSNLNMRGSASCVTLIKLKKKNPTPTQNWGCTLLLYIQLYVC